MSEARRLFAIAWEERAILLRALRRHGVSPREVDDVAQTAMCDVWKLLSWGLYEAPEGVDERVALRSFLYGVGRIAALRHRTRRKPEGEPLTDNIPGRSLEAQIEAREELRIVFCRLNRVETSLVTGLAQGETIREGAIRMRMVAPTFWTKIRAVRRVLRKRLARLR